LPKKTTGVIIESNNDYLIGVKKNQPKLYDQIEATLADRNNQSSSYTTLEKSRDRVELRHIMISNVIDGINKDWIGLQQIIGVHRRVICKGKTTEETAYFISSKNTNAFSYEEGVRGHWAIENSLHWVKDVTLKEDDSKIRKGNAPQNISAIKNISLNIFRVNDYTNMAEAMRLVSNDINTLYALII
jgi:predicted transposase YbfD/YdcC